jgi:AcrR family transcriptional regulator
LAFPEKSAPRQDISFRHTVCLNIAMSRPYRLGRRQASIDRTAERILAAARRLVEADSSSLLSVGKVAREAGVTRATVYNRFGSRTGLLGALEPSGRATEAPTLREYFAAQVSRWASSPPLFRHLPTPEAEAPRFLVDTLAATDALRPGCSIKEAEDVLGALGSFATFDRLYRDGRRTTGSVVEILMRLAAAVVA